MDDRNQDISKLIQQALEEQGKLTEYLEYAPICNSKNMLKEIDEYRTQGSDLSDANEQKLNVSLLAAKALDFDDRFKDYALSLHNVWNAFLAFSNKSRVILSSGDKYEAYYFYKSHGFDLNQIWGHLDGIDFNSKIDVNYPLEWNREVAQWKAKCIPQGNYYADKKTLFIKRELPSCLGVHPEQEDYLGKVSSRIEHRFKLQAGIIVLKSIAAPVLDTWSVKKAQHQTKGGCIQYFNAQDKAKFKVVHP